MQNYPWHPVVFKPEEQLPDEDVRVIVICPGSRCIGYLHDGVWHRQYGDEEMDGVIGWSV